MLELYRLILIITRFVVEVLFQLGGGINRSLEEAVVPPGP